MRWRGQKGSENVEDVRGRGFAMGRGLPIGCGGLLLVLVIAYMTGSDPSRLLMLLQESAPPVSQDQGAPTGPPQDELGQFASVVLADTEQTWRQIFAQSGRRYEEPRLVLFSEGVRSACGLSSAAVGPFYCQLDQKVYLDVSFFNELGRRLGAPGDFAAAYVIAHEVGHHVQNLLGVADQVNALRERGSEADSKALSVRMELQADCLAGVWGHHANRERQLIEPGDFEEGLRAASAIGDDRLQSLSQGYVQPESWTHGSSEQRTEWLRKGLETGDINACETFRSGRP